MANVVVRYVVRDVKDMGNTMSVVMTPADSNDSPNGTENNSLWPSTAAPEPYSQNKVELRMKTTANTPFVKNAQVVGTFAAG